MGTCCVSGCGDIKMDEENKCFTLQGKTYRELDPLSLDGSTGNIYDVLIPTIPADPNSGYFGRIMELPTNISGWRCAPTPIPQRR